MSISNPFKASSKVMVTFVYKSSPFLLKLSCLLKQTNSVFEHSYLGSSDWDGFYISIINFVDQFNKICSFLVSLIIQSPDELRCTTRLKRHSTMSTPQNDNI